MIWPFKRTPVLSPDEFAAQFPPAPCGKQTTHYTWEKLEMMGCPVCAAIEQRRRKDAELDALADKIVARLKKEQQ